MQILLFGRLRDFHNQPSLQWSVRGEGYNLDQLFRELAPVHPELMAELLKPGVLIAVNQQFVDRDQNLVDSDQLAFLPPVTGG